MSTTYIDDLLERARSTEYPVGQQCTVGYMARKEMETISDPIHLDALEQRLKAEKDWDKIIVLARICSFFIRNTGNQRAKDIFLAIPYEGIPQSELMYLIMSATRARLIEYAPRVRKMLQSPDRTKERGVVYPSAVEYLAQVIGVDAIPEIGQALDNDFWGCSNILVFTCCIELGNLKHPAALPFLERAMERHAKGRKEWQLDVRAYAYQAKKEIIAATQPAVAPSSSPTTTSD
jgi:hypothetical protein